MKISMYAFFHSYATLDLSTEEPVEKVPLHVYRGPNGVFGIGDVGSIPGGYKQSSPMPVIQRAIRRLASARHLPLAYRSLMT